jgi:hypothetical protein
MSAISFRAAQRRLVLRYVAPALATVLGVIVLIVGFLSGQADPTARAELIVGGGGAFALGLLELWWRIRAGFSPDPTIRTRSNIRADIAGGVLFAALGLWGAAVATRAFVTDFGPTRVVDGRMTYFHDFHTRNSGSVSLRLDGGPTEFRSECWHDCSSLQSLKTTPRARLHLTVIGARIAGVTANGHELLAEATGLRRLRSSDAMNSLAMGLVALGSALYAAKRFGDARNQYQFPDGAGEARYRALLHGALSGRGSERP